MSNNRVQYEHDIITAGNTKDLCNFTADKVYLIENVFFRFVNIKDFDCIVKLKVNNRVTPISNGSNIVEDLTNTINEILAPNSTVTISVDNSNGSNNIEVIAFIKLKELVRKG